MSKRLLAFAISVLILAGCSDKNTVRINGTVSDKSHAKIFISRIDVDTYVRIDSAKIRKNGKFSFKIKVNEPDFYQMGYSNSDFITILAEPGEKIKLTFPENKLFENYVVQGSEGTKKIKMLDDVLANTKRRLDSLKTIFDTVSKNVRQDTARESELNSEYLKVIKEQRNKTIEFLIKNLNSFASIKALYQTFDDKTFVLYDPRDLQFLKLVSDSLIFHYPNSKQARSLKKNFEKEMNQMFMKQIEEAAKNAPEINLDPNLKDIRGKRIALSSLKGKVVLLCFWATASDESVAENLSFKELYKIYKPKGFEIYQINLDESEDIWKKAVKFDELPWISVREDNPQDPVNARLYNVRAVPANYLYDKSGQIIGVNLHGQTLQLKLSQLLAN